MFKRLYTALAAAVAFVTTVQAEEPASQKTGNFVESILRDVRHVNLRLAKYHNPEEQALLRDVLGINHPCNAGYQRQVIGLTGMGAPFLSLTMASETGGENPASGQTGKITISFEGVETRRTLNTIDAALECNDALVRAYNAQARAGDVASLQAEREELQAMRDRWQPYVITHQYE